MTVRPEKLSALTAQSGVKFGTSGARGLVSELTPALCWVYTQAFLRILPANSGALVLGHDLRPSSPDIARACMAAAKAAGIDCIFAGALPTPAIAHAAQVKGLAALVVTGSHIPFERNGLKFYRATGEITKADEMAMLRELVIMPQQVPFVPLPDPDPSARDIYLQRYMDLFSADSLSGMRVGIYEHSSVARDLLHTLLQFFGAETISLGRTDEFVQIDTEAVRLEDIVLARHWAREHYLDAIVSTDGDADRPLIGDECGSWLRGDIVGILCAQALRAQTVVTPVSSNTAVEKSGSFARVIRTRIGSPYVIEAMSTAESEGGGSVVGYEANGGFLVGGGVHFGGKYLKALPTRDAMLPILLVLSMSKRLGITISALTDDLPKRFTHSDRLPNFPREKSRTLLDQLMTEERLVFEFVSPDVGGLIACDTADGVRMTFSSGVTIHVRPSGNAPELRCYTEAETPLRARNICAECLEKIAARE